MHTSSALTLYLVRDEESCDLGDKVLTYWKKRKKKLDHDYSKVAFLLNPHPKVMAEAAKAKNLEHDEAVERLIVKLFLDPTLVGQDRNTRKAELMDLFWDEFSDFTNRLGLFNSDDMWFIAAKDDTKAHEWHKKYSVSRTKVLGKMGCKTTSKALGTGKITFNMA